MTDDNGRASKLVHPWSADTLLAKAQRYAEEMRSYSPQDWQYGLFSAFVLEFLMRAAVARVSPTLLADTNDWNNVYYALGNAPKEAKFIPRSIDLTSLIKGLRDLYPEFTSEELGFVAQHVTRRNEELHTGNTPFDGADPAWLGRFYQSCQILLKCLGEELACLTGPEEAGTVAAIVSAFRDESAKTVNKTVAAHKTVWESSDSIQRRQASHQAALWATPQKGHRVKCPACASDALLTGTPVSEARLTIEEDLIVETQQHLPEKFECIACHLKIAGLSQLSVCGLGAPYKSTSTYNAADYYADQYAAGFEDDNNEY
jgi:hypothetical protein